MKIIKKILVVGIFIVLLLVAAFFAMGLIFPNIEAKSEVEIDKPVEVVWAYFTDESKAGEWIDSLRKIETIKGARTEVGSKFRMTFDEDGREIVMTQTITELKPQEVFAFRLENEVMGDDVRVTFRGNGEKTIVTQEDKMVGGNIFWRSLFAVLQSSMKTNVEKILIDLKKNVEKLP
ncbi:MAG: SRPBCC family protein [Pyrinomonadaceae bacterium]